MTQGPVGVRALVGSGEAEPGSGCSAPHSGFITPWTPPGLWPTPWLCVPSPSFPAPQRGCRWRAWGTGGVCHAALLPLPTPSAASGGGRVGVGGSRRACRGRCRGKWPQTLSRSLPGPAIASSLTHVGAAGAWVKRTFWEQAGPEAREPASRLRPPRCGAQAESPCSGQSCCAWGRDRVWPPPWGLLLAGSRVRPVQAAWGAPGGVALWLLPGPHTPSPRSVPPTREMGPYESPRLIGREVKVESCFQAGIEPGTARAPSLFDCEWGPHPAMLSGYFLLCAQGSLLKALKGSHGLEPGTRRAGQAPATLCCLQPAIGGA